MHNEELFINKPCVGITEAKWTHLTSAHWVKMYFYYSQNTQIMMESTAHHQLSVKKQSYFLIPEKTHWTCDAFTFLKPAWFISFISLYTHPEFRFYYATLGHGRLKYVTQRTSVLLKRSNKQDCVHTVDGAGNVYQTHTKQLGGEWWGETEISYPTGPLTSTELYHEQLGFILRAAVLRGISIFIQFVWPWHLLGETLVICKY